MASLKLRDFTSDDVPAAGTLLARRHARHREFEPLLAVRYQDPATAEAEVAKLLATDGASGSVALADGRLVGYLLGTPRTSGTWGPNIWVEAAGHAVDEPETIRDLYAHAAERWVDEGRTAHYALAPAHDRGLTDAWVRLSFGFQHMHGIQAAPTSPYAAPRAVTVRNATRDDIQALARLDLSLPDHQGRSPVFSSAPVPTLEETIAEWDDDFDNPAFKVLVAEHQGMVVGSAIGCALDKSGSHQGPARPDNAGFLGFAAVLPQSRGNGAGRALGEAVLTWAAGAGFDSVVTDWRVTNLLSSRAWPALGFRDTFVRLHRTVGY